jgi:hypothetical protein
MWSDYNLWPEHVPDHTLVVLSGKDRLCQADAILEWLTNETDARVMYDADMRHAGLVVRPWMQEDILGRWRDMASEAEAGAGPKAPVAPAAPARGRVLVEAVAAGASDDDEVAAAPRAPAPAAPRPPSALKQPGSVAAPGAPRRRVQLVVPEPSGPSSSAAAAASPPPAARSASPPAPAPRRASPAPPPRPSPFMSAVHAAAAADNGAAGAPPSPAAAAAPAPAPVAPPSPAPAPGPEVKQLVQQLREQQERVRAQEAANRAAAQQLLAIAEAVARSQAALASPLLSAPLAGSVTPADAARISLAAAGGGGGSDDGEGGVDVLGAASSYDSEDSAASEGPLGGCAGAAAGLLRQASGDVALLRGRDARSPFFAAASAAGAPRPLLGASSLRRRGAALRDGGKAAAAGLGGTMSIDLGALAYAGGAIGCGAPGQRLAGLALAEAELEAWRRGTDGGRLGC